jgi:hypothetical protein
MKPRTCAVRLVALLPLLGGWALSPSRSAADAPGCVELVLPEALGSRESWRSLLQQELKPLATAPGASCAQIAVLLAPGAREPNALQVSWDTQLRTIALALGDLPAAQRPRAAALLARGVLQQLVHASDAGARERAAAMLAAQSSEHVPSGAPELSVPRGRSAPPSERNSTRLEVDAPGKTAASGPPTARSPRSDESASSREGGLEPAAREERTGTALPAQAATKRATPASESDRVDTPTQSARRQRQWSGMALAGSTLILNQLHPLIHFELAVQRRVDALRARVALSLTGAVTQTRTLQLGGPGVRVGMEFALARNSLARVWLGPGANLSELILARTDDTGATRRSVHTVVSLDLRLNLELVLSRKALLLLGLESAYVLRYLDVRKDQNRMLAYAGMLVGLRVGAGF